MGWLIDWLIISLSLCLPIVYSDWLTDWFINCFSVSPYLLFILIDWSIVSLSLSPLLLFWQNDQFLKKIDSVSVSLYSIPTNCLRFFYWFSLYFVHFLNKLIVFFYQFSLRLLICILFWPNRLFEWLILTLYLYFLFRRVDWSIDSLSVSLSPIHDCWRIDWFSFCLIISSSDLLINYL